EGDREAVVIVDVRIGGQEAFGIGIGLGGLVGDAQHLVFGEAAGGDQADQLGKRVFHGGIPELMKRAARINPKPPPVAPGSARAMQGGQEGGQGRNPDATPVTTRWWPAGATLCLAAA